MSWAQSLIKLATYEVETLQKRLAEVRDRREAAELKLAVLEAEGEAEMTRPDADPMDGLYRAHFMAALRDRKAQARAEIEVIAIEEQGARDALTQAFEEQKKYEQVAEQARVLEARNQAKRETAALDELGLRKLAR
ncbi:flagellar export protein FliJ [Phenylobacterium soli]|uniref:Flagellar export protein FliJ n=1 Tax=Phenylobacterium soli TaxID=2170551 RepID=A0A328AIJ8_9CAUL|nr:flagellar export protein FliJ [Phenylobacterium soli]RAK54600.1 flagellar export protein FliJ [Phenylobacterium soli]